MLTFALIVIAFFIQNKFPRQRVKTSNTHLLEDLNWFFINNILYLAFFSMISVDFAAVVSGFLIDSGFFFDINKFNLIIQTLFLIVVTDFVSYFAHYFLHRSAFLWKLHKLHHSITQFNPLSAFRHSIYEKIYISLFVGGVLGVFSCDETSRLIVSIFVNGACIIQHSCVRTPKNKLIRWLFITPHNHMYHHSVKNFHKFGQNFGLFFTIWDRVFKTYHEDTSLVEVGISDKDFPSTFLKRLIYPLNLKKSLKYERKIKQ